MRDQDSRKLIPTQIRALMGLLSDEGMMQPQGRMDLGDYVASERELHSLSTIIVLIRG